MGSGARSPVAIEAHQAGTRGRARGTGIAKPARRLRSCRARSIRMSMGHSRRNPAKLPPPVITGGQGGGVLAPSRIGRGRCRRSSHAAVGRRAVLLVCRAAAASGPRPPRPPKRKHAHARTRSRTHARAQTLQHARTHTASVRCRARRRRALRRQRRRGAFGSAATSPFRPTFPKIQKRKR